ncbi:hypothetical protein JTE88_00630 [Arcanobacterium phocisimile]|uniref:Uncharacterized protein n=1 Tax=Arcanobacterium phocisimile TaxID=1302235 RepID=A0ABX7IKE5_9ACTO|nr:hypothetical protein [Arcanobacterium phocisimile]QRV02303.1 hypothetical protein JTE88_00630 [Arcanobacterium phocisimile]
MTTTYLMAVSDSQASAFLDNGYDLIAGFAVDAAALADVTDVSKLLDVLQLRFPGSPFSDDGPLHVLHLPADAFVQARPAVGPLHPQAFRGGIIEPAPFDGSGIVEGGGVRTELLMLDPCRITTGSRLWSFIPGEDEPILRGVYHGITYGWENTETGTFVAGVPSPFAGATVKRAWGDVPCDVELEDDQPVAVTLVCPFEPEDEEGFEQLENQLWAKRIAYDESFSIYTPLITAQLSGIPVRILRAVSTEEHPLMFQIVSLVPDAVYCTAVNFQRWAGGTYTALALPENLENQNKQEASPVSWSLADRPAATTHRTTPLDIANPNMLVQEAFNLLGQTTPPAWTELSLQAQIIGDHISYEANAKLSNGQGARLKIVPTAVLHYLRQLKKLRTEACEAPFFAIVLQAVRDGQGSVSLNAEAEPPYADQVPDTEWAREYALVKASGHPVPQWLVAKVSKATSTGSSFGPGATINERSHTDLTSHISAVPE